MFCKTAWKGLHILPDGYIRLCSIGANSKPELDMQRCRDRDGNVMHILTHSIKDIMNSDKHREVRKLNVENPLAWSPHCDCCETREIVTNFDKNHRNKSRRIYLMRVEDGLSDLDYADKIADDGSVDWMPSSLDIRFGNLCNQKCIMCSPVYSNLWYDEHFDYYKTTSFGQGKQIQVVRGDSGKWQNPPELQWFEDPRWWAKFEEMIPHLRHIYITGGEPMVTPAHDTMLDMIIDSGHAKNIWLEYDTNGSAVNDKIAQRWFNFKSVHVRVSMDGINDTYELIRFPGKWNKFTENVKKLQEYQTQSSGKIQVQAMSSCFQISTMFSVIDNENWCKANGLNFHLRFLEGPDFHSVASLPDFAKLELIEYFSKNTETSEKAGMIVKYLQLHLGVDNLPAISEFVKFMDYLDTTRGTQWKDIIPGTADLISRTLSTMINKTNQ